MIDSEIARLEEQLRLTLPAGYIEIARRLGEDVQGLRGLLGKGMNRPLMWSAEEVLEINSLVRRDPAFHGPAEFKNSWPDHYLLCGYEKAGTIYYVIDTRDSSLRVFEILAKTRKLEPCVKYPDVAALADHALAQYRQLSAKTKGAQAKMSATRPAAKPKPAARPEAAPATAPAKSVKPAIVQALRNLLNDAGFKIEPPRRKHSIESLTSDIVPTLPAELHALYEVCDGGVCERLGRLRLLPLSEAAPLARTFCDWRPSMGYFPVMDQNSDPCCVCTAGPLTGYVVFVNHDGPHFILARSLSDLLGILARTPASGDWSLEDAMYRPAPPRHVPFQFAGAERTAADLGAARELLKLAETCVGAGDEYGHLFEIALKLLTDEQVDEIIPLLNRDHEVRQVAQLRLAEMKSPRARAALQTAEDELAAFVETAAAALQRAGLDAHVVKRTNIRIDPGPVWLNMPVFYDGRARPDVWDSLVERAKALVGLAK